MRHENGKGTSGEDDASLWGRDRVSKDMVCVKMTDQPMCIVTFQKHSFICFCFSRHVSQCRPGSLGTCSINQAGLELRDHLPVPPER